MDSFHLLNMFVKVMISSHLLYGCSSKLHVCCVYSGPCIIRQPIQPEKYDLKFEVVLKWRDIYIENISSGFTDSQPVLKWRELLNRGVLNRKDHCMYIAVQYM